jgi:hypothetical protein
MCKLLKPSADGSKIEIQPSLATQGYMDCQAFDATGITTYLEAACTLENAQAMSAHKSVRTAKICDCTGNETILNEIERIPI